MTAGEVEQPRVTTGGYRYVQPVISPRAGGLSVRVNMNPDGRCNFACVYCEVRRGQPGTMASPDLPVALAELADVLTRIRRGEASSLPGCAQAPAELLRLGHVALSGDGEPTLCPRFVDVIEGVLHLRALGHHGFFKIALVTNGSALDRPDVREGLRLLTRQDEIWAKLDAGTPEWFRRVNQPEVPYDHLLDNLRLMGRERSLVIQSLIPRLAGSAFPADQRAAFVSQLRELRGARTQIDRVQIYSVSRPAVAAACSHAPLNELSGLARQIRDEVGVPAAVY
jgi:wyosine [tRNA(Phe)-imidazoG37] synthetase (radical SAM superfamily)